MTLGRQESFLLTASSKAREGTQNEVEVFKKEGKRSEEEQSRSTYFRRR